MSELPLIAVTDSATCPRPLAEQIERLAKLTKLRPQAVILRAKSLDKAAYRTLALQAQQSCEAAGIPLILHSDWQLASELGIKNYICRLLCCANCQLASVRISHGFLHLFTALKKQSKHKRLVLLYSSPDTSILRSVRQALHRAVLAFCRPSAVL